MVAIEVSNVRSDEEIPGPLAGHGERRAPRSCLQDIYSKTKRSLQNSGLNCDEGKGPVLPFQSPSSVSENAFYISVILLTKSREILYPSWIISCPLLNILLPVSDTFFVRLQSPKGGCFTTPSGSSPSPKIVRLSRSCHRDVTCL